MSENNGDDLRLDTHLKEWQELSRRLSAQLAPTQEMQEALRKSIKPILDAQNSLHEVLKPILAQQSYWKTMMESIQIPSFDLPDLYRVTAAVADLDTSIQRYIAPVFDQLQRTFKELPPLTQEALLLLGEHGWFFDLDMPFASLWQLREALLTGNVQEAEDWLCKYFEGELSVIENRIVTRFPHRAKLIGAAFAAHRRTEYGLSIPVLFAQTDGICKEVVDQHLFRKQNRKPCTAVYVERIAANSLRAALLSPLAETLPISASEHERAGHSVALNRHTVLHGESLDYGTRANGLKTISLLNYVVQVLEDAD